MTGILIQGHLIGKSYGNRNYMVSTYPDLNHQGMVTVMNNKARKIQTLLNRNKFRTKTQPILNNRVNARTLENVYNLPPNTLVSYFPIDF
jgi:hypothetical protein